MKKFAALFALVFVLAAAWVWSQEETNKLLPTGLESTTGVPAVATTDYADIVTDSHPALNLAGSGTFLSLNGGTQVLTVNAVDMADTNDVTGTLAVGNGGTGLATITANRLVIGAGTGALIPLGAMTDGQLVVGSTGVAPVIVALTGGTNIGVVNGAGTITINLDGTPTVTGLVITGISGVLRGVGGTVTGSSTTSDLSEGTNLYYTDERVDDQVAVLIQDNTGITWAYDDGAGTLTPTITFSSNALLDGANHTDTTNSGVVLGTIIYGDATPEWTALAGSTASTRRFLTQTGTGAVSAAPVWGTNIALASEVTGVLPEANIDALIARDAEVTTDIATHAGLPDVHHTAVTSEVIDDQVAVLIQDGVGIAWTYNDGLGTLTGDAHVPVTLSGTPDYITLSGQDIVRGLIVLTTDVSGLLPEANIAADIARDAEVTAEIGTHAGIASDHHAKLTLEEVDDQVAVLMTDTTSMAWTYTDVAGTLEGNVPSDGIVEAMLKAVNTPNDEEILTFETTTGDFEWHTGAELGLVHDEVTLAGTPDYITLSGQVITRALVDLTTDVSGALPVPNGGTGVGSLTSGALLLGGGTGNITALSVMTNGQLLIGDGADPPTAATLTGTAGNITIANGAGSITLDVGANVALSADIVNATGGDTMEGPFSVDGGSNAVVSVNTTDVAYTVSTVATNPRVLMYQTDAVGQDGVATRSTSDTADRPASLELLRQRVTGTAVSSGDVVGEIMAAGDDGTDYEETAAIRFEVDGAVSGGTVPQKIVFETGATNSASRTSRMEIASSGAVTIVGSPVSTVATLDTEAKLEAQITDMANIIQETEIDTEAKLEAIVTDMANIIQEAEIDTVAKLDAIVTDGALDDDDVSDDLLDGLAETSLADPGADRIVFWDDSDTLHEYLEAGTALTIAVNTLNVDDVFLSNTGDTGVGAYVITGDLGVDNLNLNGNTLISLDTNGDINLTPDGTGDVVVDGNVVIGTTVAQALLHVDNGATPYGISGGVLIVNQDTALGNDLDDTQLILQRVTNVSNDFRNNLWVRRDTGSGTTWTTTRLHDAISIDNSFVTPGTDTLVWYERDALDEIHEFGSGATSILILDADAGSESVFNEDSIDMNFRFEGNGQASLVFLDGGLDMVGVGEAAPAARLDVTQASADVAIFNRTSDDGTLVSFEQDGTEEGDIAVSGTTVSYNPFTGSHYGWSAQSLSLKGILVRMTGVNKRVHAGDEESEPVYGVVRTTVENDKAVLGTFLTARSMGKVGWAEGKRSRSARKKRQRKLEAEPWIEITRAEAAVDIVVTTVTLVAVEEDVVGLGEDGMAEVLTRTVRQGVEVPLFNEDGTTMTVRGLLEGAVVREGKIYRPTRLEDVVLTEEERPPLPLDSLLIMAVGNGWVWVTDGGVDVEPGDLLISSEVEGHARTYDPDSGEFSTAYSFGIATEVVVWDDVAVPRAGPKRKLISCVYDRAIVR